MARGRNSQGYQSIVGSRLSNLLTAKTLQYLDTFSRHVTLSNICTVDIKRVPSVSQIPDNIIDDYYVRIPDEARWEPYYNNGENKSNSFLLDVMRAVDGDILKFNVKLSKRDYDRIIKGEGSEAQLKEISNKWLNTFKDFAINRLENITWNKMVDNITINSSYQLSGNNAGIRGDKNFGSLTSPLVLSPTVATQISRDLKRELVRLDIMTQSESPYLLVPPEFVDNLSLSDLATNVIRSGNSKYNDPMLEFIKTGNAIGIEFGGTIFVPDYYQDPDSNGIYTFLGGSTKYNKARMFVTDMRVLEETTHGDEMVWLVMHAGIGTVVSQPDANAVFRVRIPN